MIKNPIVLALISATMVCLAYFLNNKCNDEEINKSTMVKLSVISVGVSLLTYHFLNSYALNLSCYSFKFYVG